MKNAAKGVFDCKDRCRYGADTAENERNFAENLPKIGNYRTGPGYGADAADEGALEVHDVLEVVPAVAAAPNLAIFK